MKKKLQHVNKCIFKNGYSISFVAQPKTENTPQVSVIFICKFTFETYSTKFHHLKRSFSLDFTHRRISILGPL